MNTRAAAKRILDVVLGGTLFLLSIPLQCAVVAAVYVDSGAPVVYRARRVGRDGRLFTLYKFRTMVSAPETAGPRVTRNNDPRVSRVGRFVRRTRLDELPQLWNVVRGDMSLVGPRPEDPAFVAIYTAEQRRVLSVRPGITGLGQLSFRNEAALLEGPDPETAYIERIMARKIALDLEYLDRQGSLLLDLTVLWQTSVVFANSLFSTRH